jgi:hypothetical protein
MNDMRLCQPSPRSIILVVTLTLPTRHATAIQGLIDFVNRFSEGYPQLTAGMTGKCYLRSRAASLLSESHCYLFSAVYQARFWVVKA